MNLTHPQENANRNAPNQIQSPNCTLLFSPFSLCLTPQILTGSSSTQDMFQQYRTVDEIWDLVDVCFEYVTKMDGVKILRKVIFFPFVF